MQAPCQLSSILYSIFLHLGAFAPGCQFNGIKRQLLSGNAEQMVPPGGARRLTRIRELGHPLDRGGGGSHGVGGFRGRAENTSTPWVQ